MHDDGDEFGDVYDNRRIFYSVHTEAQWTQREDGTASCPGDSIELEIFVNIWIYLVNIWQY